MKYPSNITTVKGKILHCLHVYVTCDRSQLDVSGSTPTTISATVSALLKKDLIKTNKLDKLVLTENGHKEYTKLINRPSFPEISVEQAISIFGDNDSPKTLHYVMNAFYGDFDPNISKHKAAYLVSKLVRLGLLVVYDSPKTGKTYITVNNPLIDSVYIPEVDTEAIEKENLRIITIANLFKLLPGTLTASYTPKPYLY